MSDPFDRSFRDRVLAGETLLGLFLDLGAPASAELCAAAGYDWLIVDLEHGAGTEADLLGLFHAVEVGGSVPLVRPQSGERIRGRDNVKAINDNYPEMTGSTPKLTLRRVSGEGSHWVAEGTIDYGDGTPVSYVGVTELRDGRIAAVTEYFGNPFEAPAWRAPWVERIT